MPIKRRALIFFTALGAFATAGLGLIAGVAGDLLPDWMRKYPAAVWGVFGILVVLTVACAVLLAKLAAAEDDQRRLAATLRTDLDKLPHGDEIFGGRDEELQTLGSAVDNGGYTFVTGESGFGKTALLANFVRRLSARSNISIVYHFVCRERQEANEESVFRNLCQQLASCHGRTGTLPGSVAELRVLYRELLLDESSPATGRRIVVVLDGLDEAEGWSFLSKDFPVSLPRSVSVVFSARRIADDRPWEEKLGVAGRVTVIDLGALDERKIASLLRSSKNDELIRNADDPEFVRAIYDVSKGDPFYLHYLVLDLIGNPESPAEIRQLPVDLKEYFRQWWTNEVSPLAISLAVDDLIGYLLVAKGPLNRADLVDIDADDAINGANIDGVIVKLNRYLIGDDDTGYTYCHRRFRDYIADRIPSDEQATYRQRVLAWCRRHREHGWGAETPNYVFAHFAEHLFDAHCYQEIVDLVDEAWMLASGHRLRSLDQFRRDLHMAIESPGIRLTDLLRLSLLSAEQGAFGAAVPQQALRALVSLGQENLAEQLITLSPPGRHRALASVAVAEEFTDRRHPDKARQLLANTVSALVAHQSGEGLALERPELLTCAEILAAAAAQFGCPGVIEPLRVVGHPADADLLVALAPALCIKKQDIAWIDAILRTIQDHGERAQAYLRLVRRLRESPEADVDAVASLSGRAAAEATKSSAPELLAEAAITLAAVGEPSATLAERARKLWSAKPGDQAQTALLIARASAAAGDARAANEIALRLVQESSPDDRTDLVPCLVRESLIGPDEALASTDSFSPQGAVAVLLAVMEAFRERGEAGRAAEMAHRALAMVQDIPSGSPLEDLLTRIAPVLGEAGDRDTLAKLLRGPITPWTAHAESAAATAALARAAVALGESDAVEWVVQQAKAKGRAYDVSPIGAIANLVVSAGVVDDAAAAARQSASTDDRAQTLAALALALTRAGQQSRARPLLQESLDAAISIPPSEPQIVCLARVATALNGVGDAPAARQAIGRATEALRASDCNPAGMRAIGQAATAMAEPGLARPAIEMALETVAAMETAAAMTGIPIPSAHPREWSTSIGTGNRPLRAMFGSGPEMVDILGAIAGPLGEPGSHDLLERATAIADAEPSSWWRTLMQAALVPALVADGVPVAINWIREHDGEERYLLTTALAERLVCLHLPGPLAAMAAAAEADSDRANGVRAMMKVGAAYAQLGENAPAERLLQQARQETSQASFPERTWVLATIARLTLLLGNREDALTLADEVIGDCLPGRYPDDYALASIAKTLALAGQPRRAADIAARLDCDPPSTDAFKAAVHGFVAAADAGGALDVLQDQKYPPQLVSLVATGCASQMDHETYARLADGVLETERRNNWVSRLLDGYWNARTGDALVSLITSAPALTTPPLLHRAAEVAAGLGSPGETAPVLASVAAAHTTGGDQAAATDCAKRALATAHQLSTDDFFTVAERLIPVFRAEGHTVLAEIADILRRPIPADLVSHPSGGPPCPDPGNS